MASTSVLILVESLVSILLIATVVFAICKRLNFPFTVALVLVGLLIANTDLQPLLHVQITPDLILFVFLPTLIFESAFNLDGNLLKKNIVPVLVLAVPGLLISTFIIGTIVWLVSPFDFPASLLLGAILSATDPVAVISLFKQLGAPTRLTVLVEGESLFNDATSVVTAKIIFSIIAAGAFSLHHIEEGILHFSWEFFGGIIAGWLMAIAMAWLIGRVKSDIYIEISLTMILAYASFIIAQEVLHVSGIMATVAAGVVLGGWGRVKISPTVAHFLHEYWEYLAFLANALIFLLVGLSINLAAFSPMLLVLLGVVIIAMLISRASVVYGLLPIIKLLPNAPKITPSYQHVMYWGGLRGAIALAIVLSLSEFEHYDSFIMLVSGAVLFTLLVQGLTIEKLVKCLGLDKPPLAEQLAKIETTLSAKRYSLEKLPSLQTGGLFSASISKSLQSQLQAEISDFNTQLDTLTQSHLNEQESLELLMLKSLAALKKKHYQLFADGHYSETTYRNLIYLDSVQADVVKYWHHVDNHYTPTHSPHPLKALIVKISHHTPGLRQLYNAWLTRRASADYEMVWGQYQGTLAVLAFLGNQAEKSPEKIAQIRHVEQFFESWKQQAQVQLDTIAEQFPEFVNQMQTSLAERLMIQSERQLVVEQAKAGLIPENVAKSLEEEYDEKTITILKHTSTRLNIDAGALLRKVPFFSELPEDDFKKIQSALIEEIIPTGEAVIAENAQDDSMYLIIRGVVRVSKIINGEPVDLATLVAGDFFGEMALLHKAPRTATCRTVTPCVLFELKRSQFEVIKTSCPAIQTAMEQADIARRLQHKP